MRTRATCGMLCAKSKQGEVHMQGRILGALVAALCATAAPSGAAHAQALPGWKIPDICAKESAPGQCADFEGQALKAVSASWAFVLDPIRQACLAQVKSPLDQSWRLLAECIDIETLKALDKGAVRTARTPAEPVPPPRPAEPPPGAASPAPDPAASATSSLPTPSAAAPPPPPAPAATPPTEQPKQ
jgi:hypothetical protein